LKIRLLGDAVLRRMAWELADQLGWATTYDAEYLALTRLQADAFITLDAGLAKSAEGISRGIPRRPPLRVLRLELPIPPQRPGPLSGSLR
jgi:hypothetical protein